MTAFDRVMAQPASLAARYALLEDWKASKNPQAELLEKQLAYRLFTGTNRRSDQATRLSDEINQVIEKQGRVWAGRVAELVPKYKFLRGLVTEVYVPGERFLELVPQLLALQPIQRVSVTAPWGSIEAIANSPLVAKLSSLGFDGAGAAMGDRGAIALAQSPHVRNLVVLSLGSCELGRAGVEAIAASRNLANATYIYFHDNPVDPTPRVIDDGEGTYAPFRPDLAVELEAAFGPRAWLALPTGYLPTWPPSDDELALVHDYVQDHQLATLETLALEVDQLEAGNEEQQITAGAKRQRLLIELDVYGLLTGQPDVGARLASYPTLRGYHDACVQMASYHASASRIRLVGNAIPLKPTDGHVSFDWFRQSSGYVPDKVSPHDWLALCERNFIDPMPTQSGNRFVRLEGKLHVLSYRVEATSSPKLWRALPA